MDFIERWLHISPDGGNGVSEFLIVALIVLVIVSILAVRFRNYFPKNLVEFLEQLGNRESSDRFDS